jgi:hypothetical protein
MTSESKVDTSRSTGELIFRYAKRFNDELVDGKHGVASPLGAWLLVALVAPLAQGETRSRVEEVLGTDAEDAFARASALLDKPHKPICSAAAAWYRDELVLRQFRDWARTMPTLADTGPIPSSEAASQWARDKSLGLIENFPLNVDDDDPAVVLATMVATKIDWDQPFDVVPSQELGGPFGDAIRTALKAPSQHHVTIAGTESAGDVGVHWAASADGLRVFSVIADSKVPPPDVAQAAHEVARSFCGRLVRPSTRSLFDLPLGNGHAWTIREETRALGRGGREIFHAVLPAWTAQTVHALGGTDTTLGFAEVADVITAACHPDFPYRSSATQMARASYHARGFEAAAVTGVKFASAMSRAEPRTIRIADVRFNRPYAVVAMTTRSAPSDGWSCVPVFSAWVAEPTNA